LGEFQPLSFGKPQRRFGRIAFFVKCRFFGRADLFDGLIFLLYGQFRNMQA
jgi:hypothetical protein